ncbi:MAG TPA: hypothetical protein VGG61_14650 [Gemmataceae bacterium]
MSDLKTIHREAMEQTDLALAARQQGDEVKALLYFHKAYDLEAQAATALSSRLDAEPTRSVLLRSAATLALDCKLIAEAEKLVCTALIGNPPEEIADELRDLLEQIHFERHLALRGIQLQPDEIQMSIAGKAVGYGIAPTEAFLHRVENAENLLYRTAERQQNRPYRDRGRRDKSLSESLQLFISVPRAASFAVTFRVGASPQLNLPGLSLGEGVIDELVDCLELYTRGDEEQLRARITEEAYYRNFVSLAQNIAPDGRNVELVGFTTVRSGTPKQVRLTHTALPAPPFKDYSQIRPPAEKKPDQETVQVTGTLKMADATKKTDEIKIISAGRVRHTVVVPPGMMSDIVKPLWDTEVTVTGVQKGRKIHLIQIRAVEPD